MIFVKHTHFLLVVFATVLFLSSCSRQNNSTEPPMTKKPPLFNPYYFRSPDQHYYAVMIKYKDSRFQLAENKVYKLPGRSIDLKKFPEGNFRVSYFSASNNMIDEVSIASPLEAWKENGHLKFTSAHQTTVDSTVFLLPLHSSNQTRKLRIQAYSFIPVEFNVPSDTIDVVANNQKLIPDTSLFGERK